MKDMKTISNGFIYLFVFERLPVGRWFSAFTALANSILHIIEQIYFIDQIIPCYISSFLLIFYGGSFLGRRSSFNFLVMKRLFAIKIDPIGISCSRPVLLMCLSFFLSMEFFAFCGSTTFQTHLFSVISRNRSYFGDVPYNKSQIVKEDPQSQPNIIFSIFQYFHASLVAF